MFRGRRESSNVKGAGKVHPIVRARLSPETRLTCGIRGSRMGLQEKELRISRHMAGPLPRCQIEVWS